jgi:catechol 2,3-dioxygenase-like lactoylglutathione lyase family enzyme
MIQTIRGLHHVTAIAIDPQANIDFYTQVLGLRLVKDTVNFDDPSTYHFYYGDKSGNPGTILTFFPFVSAGRGRRGSGMVDTVAFAAPAKSLDGWIVRLAERGVDVDGPFAFDPSGEEMTFIAAPEPKAPVTQGWLRVSQRKLDPQRSIEYLPYYPHDERQLLEPGEIYEVDLEIWPMGLALPAGSRLTLTIQGKDFERPGATGPLRGVAWFTHDDPTDRPSELFAGTNSIYTGGPHQSYLLLPMLPSR